MMLRRGTDWKKRCKEFERREQLAWEMIDALTLERDELRAALAEKGKILQHEYVVHDTHPEHAAWGQPS